MTRARGHARDTTPRASVPEDVPYTMRLPDGRTLFVLLPAAWCERDVTGELLFKPEAARHLDRIRALAMKAPKAPTPGYVRTLREALGLTQKRFGERLGVDAMTVSRWERGTVQPGPAALKALEKLRIAAGRKGITIAA